MHLFFKTAGFLILCLIIQLSLVPLISIQGVRPDLLLIFVIYWGSRRISYQGVLLGFIAGFFQDITTGGVLGIYTLSKTIACIVAGLFPRSRHDVNLLILTVTLFVTAIVQHLISGIFLYRGSEAGWFVLLLRYGIPTAFYTAILGFIVYGFLYFRQQRRGKV
jgi:rod shape-determining protein MreD